MAILNKSSFYSKYVDPSTGLFRAGQPAYSIGPDDYEQFVADLRDSVRWPEDDRLECNVTLTAAQILTSNTSPVQLIAAPGAGKIHVIESPIIYRFFFNASFATLPVHLIRIGTSTISEASQITSSANNSINIVDLTASVIAVDTAFLNQNVNFWTQTSNPTGGGTSTLQIYFRYKTITL